MSSKASWYQLQPGFCESVLTGPPEYFASISSIAMVFFGLCGLFLTQYNNLLLRFISANLAVTGVGSIVYHWTMYHGWGQIDAMPMLISSYAGALMAIDAIIYKVYRINKQKKKLYEFLSGFLSLIFATGLAIGIAFSSTSEYSQYFSLMFLVPELVIGISVFLIRFVSHKSESEKEYFKYANLYMYIGFTMAIVAGIIWFAVEKNCKKPELHWLRHLQMHSIWHIFISYGMYLLMQYLVFINAYNKNNKPYFHRCDMLESNSMCNGNCIRNFFHKWCHILIPYVEIENTILPGNDERSVRMRRRASH